MAIYPDGIGRTVNTADYGTNGYSSFTRSDTCGTRSDVLLITTNAFDQSGDLVQITDPAATVTTQTFDQAGRRTQLVLNYVEEGGDADENQTTNWTYNADSNVATMTVLNSETEDQVTTYGYGITVAGGSMLNSNSPLQSLTYPDSGTVAVEYNRQGDVILRTDQNATVHAYSFDLLGRPSTDSVTTLARASMAGCGNRRDLRDPRHGREHHQLSHLVGRHGCQRRRAGIQWIPAVDYRVSGARRRREHRDFAQRSVFLRRRVGNTIRLTGITYPNGTTLDHNYGTTGDANDLLSRVESLILPIGDSTDGRGVCLSGSGTPVQVDIPSRSCTV